MKDSIFGDHAQIVRAIQMIKAESFDTDIKYWLGEAICHMEGLYRAVNELEIEHKLTQMKYNPEMADKYGGHRRQAALKETQILEIYTLFHQHGVDGLELASRFGVGKSTIYRIVSGESFADITGHRGTPNG